MSDGFKTLLDGLASIALVIHIALFVTGRVLDWRWHREERAIRAANEAEHAERMAAIAALKAEIRRVERVAGIPPQLALVKKDGS
jgi:hypothetical protein